MSEIAELEGRITAALDRIGAGLDGLNKPTAAAPADDAKVSALEAALEEERTANAQLEERVKTIKDRQDKTVDTLAEEVERLREMLEAEEAGTVKLRKVNADLRANNDALRTAISAGVAEPHLVNKSMMAELEALRAAQAADRSELDAVLGELGPLVDAMNKEGANA